MTKFVRVKLFPKHIRDGEFTVEQPSFFEEIEACKKKRPNTKTLTVNYLREIVASIGLKYIGESFDALADVNLSKFRGVPCETTSELNTTLFNLFLDQCPRILELAIEKQMKKCPSDAKIVYFDGHPLLTSAFLKLGLSEILEKDLAVYLGDKPKKTVGKPAISNKDIKAESIDVV